MAGGSKGRSLEETPTWAVAVVCFVLVAISIVIEHLIHLVGSWLKKKNKPALYESLEKIKAELMLLGFISLLLTVGQGPISEICISKKIGNTWHPCIKDDPKKEYENVCTKKGQVEFVSAYGIHQLHIFIFVLAISHVLYCIATLALGKLKMKIWKSWEVETRTVEYQYYNDPERFRFARETSFGRRHMSFWSNTPILLWIVSFFRQFITSVAKVDYLTLRHGFITAHLAPQSQMNFDFQKYISKSLDEDFKVVVGISPIIWFIAVLFLLTNTHGWYSYLWLPFIPLVIILMVGTKLQVIITKMGLKIQDRGDVVKGAPVVQPGDDLFWFNRPRLLLFLIHFVLFTNAFQLAFFVWSWYEFGFQSCFHKRIEDIVIRLSMGVTIQVLCSYVTLPLYALVTQMGSSMKPTIFSDQVASALKAWHHSARKHIKHGAHRSESPFSSRPGTPLHDSMSPLHGNMSPVHLLRGYRSSGVDVSPQTSPRAFHFDNNQIWGGGVGHEIPTSMHNNYVVDGSNRKEEEGIQEPNTSQALVAISAPSHQNEVHISLSDFSFNKR